jgi:recombinational DNA repair protein (RecF pathway)
MTFVSTDAIVLHVQDYLESSRIVRLATRELGVQSVLARGRDVLGAGSALRSISSRPVWRSSR